MKMNPMTSKLIVTGLLLLFTLLSGVWVSNSGRPYNTGIFTLHKLIALGAVIFTVATVQQLRTGMDTRTLAVGAVVVTGLLFLSLFASGALLSIGKPDHIAILTIHRVAPLLAVIATAATMVLLISSKS
jgi:hypothetical protein